MLVNQPLKCPISLESPPLCPQITPCGHVFAFPSIMAHLMNHGGDTLRKASPCPLCNTPIVARELRLVRAHVTPPIQVPLPPPPSPSLPDPLDTTLKTTINSKLTLTYLSRSTEAGLVSKYSTVLKIQPRSEWQ